MDKKLFAVIAAIIIVAAAGVVAFVTLADDDGDVKALTGSGRLLVYGNADNDDYLDNADGEDPIDHRQRKVGQDRVSLR